MEKSNLLVAQSGGPSMVINQSLVGVIKEAKANEVVGEIFGARHGIKGILSGDLIDLRTFSDEKLEVIAKTPSSALGSVRMKPNSDDCMAIFEALKKLNVRWFFYIGGNDSAETVDIINRKARENGEEIICFHVPKTIDNDLLENDHTPGFGSAARFVASALRGDDLDNRALGGVKIDIIMGRNAGFLTAASALARTKEGDGPHLIYLPERPFSEAKFISDVQTMMAKYGRCVCAISEGIVSEDGELIASKFSSERDSHGNMQLSGSGALGDALANLLKERTNGAIRRVRADTFGYLQRSFPGIASLADSKEARDVGSEAVKAALSGKYDSGSIAIKRAPGEGYDISYAVVPLSSVAKVTRSMPDAFIAESGFDVTEAFLEYARPIVGVLPETATI